MIAVWLLASVAAAADFSGIWLGLIPRNNSEGIDIAFQFKQKGDVLEGKIYDDFNSTPIREGKVTGDQITFVVESDEQAGNEINISRIRYSGTLKNGALELTRVREKSVIAGSNGGANTENGKPSDPFTVKRLVSSAASSTAR